MALTAILPERLEQQQKLQTQAGGSHRGGQLPPKSLYASYAFDNSDHKHPHADPETLARLSCSISHLISTRRQARRREVQ